MRRTTNVMALLLAVIVVGGSSYTTAGAAPAAPGTQPLSQGKPLAAPQSPKFAPDKLVVKLKDGARADALDADHRENGVRVKEKLKGARTSVLQLPKGLSVEDADLRYEKNPDVLYAEPDYTLYPSVVPNDTDYPKLWAHNNTGQTAGTPDADIDAPEAFDQQQGSPNTVVGVLDSGVDVSHPDLRDNLWVNPGETPANGIDDDANGYVDDVNGWDFRNEDASLYDADEITHGTHVAGIVGAKANNAQGVAGTAPGSKIAILKFIGATGSTTDAAQAIDYAVAEGIPISNNSYGCLGCFSQTLLDAVKRADTAGHLFVAAAGNDTTNTDVSPSYPANYDSPNVLTVAASDHNGALATFSNYGATSVDVAAPGTSILSTMPGGLYGYKQGSSMAAPHVSGIAALAKSTDASLSDNDIKALILNSADASAALATKIATGARANAANAIKAATPVPKATTTTIAAALPDVTYPNATTLSGKLTSSDGTVLAGRTLKIERSESGKATYSVAASVTTDANGSWSIGTGEIPVNTDYRAVYAGDLKTLGSTSSVSSVTSRVNIPNNTSTADLKLGGTRNLVGTVAPNRAGKVVSMTLKKRNVGTVYAGRAVVLDANSRWLLAYKPASTGTYDVYVTYASDAQNTGNTSVTKAFASYAKSTPNQRFIVLAATPC